MSPSRTARYKATIAKLKAEYKVKVDILCGIEWDSLSEDKPENYDYWIGAAHHLYGKNTGKYYEIDLDVYKRQGFGNFPQGYGKPPEAPPLGELARSA